jgi:hypothetical protein
MTVYLRIPDPSQPGVARDVELPLEVERAGPDAIEAFYSNPPEQHWQKAAVVPYEPLPPITGSGDDDP